MTIIVGGSELIFFSLNPKNVVHYMIPTSSLKKHWMPGRVAGQGSGRGPTKQNSTHFIPLWKIGAVIYYKFNLAYMCVRVM